MAKRILILDTGKEWGGGTNSLLELLKRIDKDKYHFTALFYNNYKRGTESDIKTEIEKLGIDFLLLEQKKQPLVAKILKELIRAPLFFNKRLKGRLVFRVDYYFRTKHNAKKISEILQKSRIDLLYMNNQPSSNLEGIIASKMVGILAIQHSRKVAILNSFEVKIVNEQVSSMICVSDGVKNEFVQHGIDSSKCVVVYNGIDTEIKPQISAQEIRKRWKISDNDILIGTVGSLIKLKRTRDFIEAIDVLSKRTSYSIMGMIVGDGSEKDNLFDEVKKKELDSKVIFTGFQPDAISYINAMDIFVLTSEKEGLPRVILEAMLLEKPVVASNVTGPSELVIDGKTGFLVSAGQPDMLADKILRLIENTELRNQMGEKARKEIDNFSIEKYVNGVEKVFTEVLGH